MSSDRMIHIQIIMFLQCIVKCNELAGVKYLNEHAAMMKKGNVEVTKEKITLCPAMSLYINLSVEARYCRLLILH